MVEAKVFSSLGATEVTGAVIKFLVAMRRRFDLAGKVACVGYDWELSSAFDLWLKHLRSWIILY